jgi:hypothetical protein
VVELVIEVLEGKVQVLGLSVRADVLDDARWQGIGKHLPASKVDSVDDVVQTPLEGPGTDVDGRKSGEVIAGKEQLPKVRMLKAMLDGVGRDAKDEVVVVDDIKLLGVEDTSTDRALDTHGPMTGDETTVDRSSLFAVVVKDMPAGRRDIWRRKEVCGHGGRGTTTTQVRETDGAETNRSPEHV